MANKGSFGGSVKLTGETEYKKALKEITDNLTVLSSEMKVASSAFSKNEDSVSSLSQKNEILKKKLEEQNKALSEANKMLNEAKTNTDSNATTVKKWQNELNKAQAEVNKTTKEISDNEKTLNAMEKANVSNTKELEEFSKAEDKAGKSSLSLGDIIKGNLISEAIIGGIKALGSAVKNVASNFSEWENMSNALKEQEAKVARVMRNTTDATDEEIQSLIDLTGAQEKLGVVTQETQLAGLQELGTYVENKESLEALLPVMNDMIAQQYGIGASMESASGIATMMGKVLGNGQVDALSRLGYKFDEAQQQVLKFGTEEEKVKILSEIIQQSVGGMNEALALTNAGKVQIATSYIEDMKKSVGSLFSDVKNGLIAEFLPAIQEVSSAITGMVSGDLSIEEGMQKISDGIMTGLETISTKIPEIIETGMKVLSSVLTGIIQMLPKIMPVVVQVINTLISGLTQMLPDILQAGITILMELVKGIAQSLPTLIPAIVDAVILMTETLIDNIDLIIDAGIEIILGLAEGLIEALPRLIEKIPVIIEKLIMAITDNLPKIIEMGITLIIKLGIGLIKAIPQLISNIPKIITAMVKGFANYLSNMAEVGKNLVKGIWNGIKDATSWILDKIKGFGKSILKGIKSIFGIHSPSTLFRDEVGKNLALGIGEGFEDEMANVNRDIQNALPTDFDLSSNVSLNSALSNQSNSDMKYYSMVDAFKQALKEVKIELNDEVAANFVDDTVRRVVYS